jgi:hypothetical protein
MRLQTLLVTSILLLTVIFLQRPSYAQSFTTITTVSTATSESTQTQYTFFTLDTTFQTTTVNPTVLDSTLQIPAAGARACEIYSLKFAATAQEVIVGSITATSNVHLYLLHDIDYRAWNALATAYCNPDDNNIPPIVSLGPATTINWQWTAPTSDTYWFLVENWDVVKSPSVHILLTSQPVATTETNYAYATNEITMVSGATQTITLYQTQQLTSQAQVLGGGGMSLVPVLGLIIVIIAIVAALVVRSRRSGKPSGFKCPKCGAQLPTKAKFCKKCGAELESANS